MRITIASLALLISNSCFAQEQVKHIGVFVEPYYRAAANAAGTPQVAVARAFDARLSLNEPTKIKEVEAEIRANPDLITPMTLMVLSIRLGTSKNPLSRTDHLKPPCCQPCPSHEAP